MAERPIPSPDPGTEPYWKAAREHRLMLPLCLDCNKYHSYPRSICPFCASLRLEWRQCSGRGKVYSFTQVHRAPSAAFADKVRYTIGIVELEEGPHLMSQLVGDDVRIDAPVHVQFEDVASDVSLPYFIVGEGGGIK